VRPDVCAINLRAINPLALRFLTRTPPLLFPLLRRPVIIAMPVELRKRKAPAAPAAPAPPAKKASRATTKANPVKAAVAKAKAVVTGKNTKKAAETTEAKNATNGAPSEAPPKGGPDKVKVGDVIALEGFGGEVETHDGEKTTLKTLVDASKSGVVLFTYPKASTPGCRLICSALLGLS
jgi:thioredoxin-dependent peroxiredoxin